MENLSLLEIAKKIKEKHVKIIDVVNSIYERIDKVDSKVEAYLTLTKEYAINRANELQNKLDNGEDIGILGGVPIAVKDNMCMKDVKTTCASKILENFVSPYTATVLEKLEEHGAIIIGKTNMDEFAMGSSTETSYFKKTKNPWDLTRVPGGSSGGSAAAVSADMAYASLGSDTGGSIRQPASLCGLVGMKPTYGLVSRYGLVAYASSLDQIGPFTKNVTDMAIMLNAIVGHDKMDTTSLDIEKIDYTKYLVNDIKDMKIGIPVEYVDNESLDRDIKNKFNEAIDKLVSLGASKKEVNLDYIKYSLASYYVISVAEASSNLGRYDGIKYGHRTKEFSNLEELYKKSRSEGFGDEVKRRIILGTYTLSSAYYDAYYKKALKVRTLIVNDFKNAFKEVDVIALPTAPSTAFKFGEKAGDPTKMLLEDMYTVPVNIAGLPAISIPCGFDENNLPIGLQFIADSLREDNLIKISYTYEQNTEFHKVKPDLKEVE